MSGIAHDQSIEQNRLGQAVLQHGMISPPPLDDMFSLQQCNDDFLQSNADIQALGATFTAVK